RRRSGRGESARAVRRAIRVAAIRRGAHQCVAHVGGDPAAGDYIQRLRRSGLRIGYRPTVRGSADFLRTLHGTDSVRSGICPDSGPAAAAGDSDFAGGKRHPAAVRAGLHAAAGQPPPSDGGSLQRTPDEPHRGGHQRGDGGSDRLHALEQRKELAWLIVENRRYLCSQLATLTIDGQAQWVNIEEICETGVILECETPVAAGG